MSSNGKTIVVTGSSGLVGSALVTYLATRGYTVRALQRNAPVQLLPNVTYVPFDLASVRDEGFEGADAIVHCAYRPIISRNERLHGPNYDFIAAEKIIALSRRRGIRLLFLSSLSAHTEAVSYYGQNKFRVEQLFDPQSDTILRLGIVIGGKSGLFGRLSASIKKYPLVPLLDGGRQNIQTVALHDVCRVIDHVLATDVAGCYDIAHAQVVMMRELYGAIAEASRVRRLFISVPAGLIYWIARIIEFFKIQPPFTSQNVLGLQDLRTSTRARTTEIFGIRLLDYQESLRSEFASHDQRN